MKKHWLDKPILRDLFWFIVVPHQYKMWVWEQQEEDKKRQVCREEASRIGEQRGNVRPIEER
jgi:hypothetical protein